jgi:proteic killer suppression protein
VRSLPAQIQHIAYRKLLMIDVAASIEDRYPPRGNRLESLQGQRSGQRSFCINAQWRICFHFVDGEALTVETVDHH